MDNLARIEKAAKIKFGEVVKSSLSQRPSGWKITIKRDRPVFPDKPYMEIIAYFTMNGVAFEHGHYDLSAADVGLEEPKRSYATFDDFEINPCICAGDEGNYEQISVTDPIKADIWSLFGHVAGEGLFCIGDFDSYEGANEIHRFITGEDYGQEFDACSSEIQQSFYRK